MINQPLMVNRFDVEDVFNRFRERDRDHSSSRGRKQQGPCFPGQTAATGQGQGRPHSETVHRNRVPGSLLPQRSRGITGRIGYVSPVTGTSVSPVRTNLSNVKKDYMLIKRAPISPEQTKNAEF